MATSHNLGFPRIGEQRELKRATERYWKGEISRAELEQVGAALRLENWKKQQVAGIDQIPSNDFSFYDQILDLSCLLGHVPERFEWDGQNADLDVAFAIARGTDDAIAAEMTKWFDTNYHYIVPEFTKNTRFKVSSTKLFDEFEEAHAAGILTRPVLVGPATYLTLGKVTDGSDLSTFDFAEPLIAAYVEILEKLVAQGAEWVQLDEPIFALALNDAQRQVLKDAYAAFAKIEGLDILVATYFGELRDNLELFTSLPVAALHIDAVRGGGEVEAVAKNLGSDVKLSVGIVDGRNVWKTDLDSSLTTLNGVRDIVGADRLWVGPACSLLHSPITLRHESKLDATIKNWLAFAEEKLDEIAFLANAVNGQVDDAVLRANKEAHAQRKNSKLTHDSSVRARIAALTDADYTRGATYEERSKLQRERLNLPLFPTTTIGSFPQTPEVRKARAAHKRGELSDSDYDAFLATQIDAAIAWQEDIGLDMLVHGEFERNDMVEFFGEQLQGYAFTEHAWVQSYGSRYVKPPIIFGDVSRPNAMTVRWSKYAQTRTNKPVKGMLTGPVTMTEWAFVRDDQPLADTVKQVALAIRDEIVDLEAAGLHAIQCDEAAFREGLPLRKADWAEYLESSSAAFRLAASGVKNETQIHTHMCYSEFNDIIESIASMDADVISIETSRSQMELLDAFYQFKYPNEIGPGVYDIHSPRVPSKEEMVELLKKAVNVLPAERLWVNPDCGLKTRGWEETKPALERLVAATNTLRAEHQMA